MTIVFEVGPPFQRRFGAMKGDLMYRVWWGWFAVALLHVSLKEYSETPKVWETPSH